MTRSARLALGATLSVLLALPGSALADTVTVTTTADVICCRRHCSLREAVTAANDNDQGPGGDCDFERPGRTRSRSARIRMGWTSQRHPPAKT